MDLPYDQISNALVAGVLLGGFYVAITVGISISFGFIDIVNIAHPAFIVLGAYIVYIVTSLAPIDPVLIGLAMTVPFYAAGDVLYRVYYLSFERRGNDSLGGLAFFFGIMFVVEVSIILAFGVDYRFVQASYIDQTYHAGPIDFPMRMIVPSGTALLMFGALQFFLHHTFIGRAIAGVAQNSVSISLMGLDPVRIKRIAFALSIATCAVAGALLIVIQPIEPSIGRDFIGRVFAICVLGGLGSLWGTVAGAMIVGIVESFTSAFIGPIWAPAVSFGLLLAVLVVRPSGLLGR